MEEELWITGLVNRTLGGPAHAFLNALNIPHDAAHPWSDWLVCEILVVAFIVVLFAMLRSRLSVDRPGKLQHIFELFHEFVHASADEMIAHDGAKYVPMFGALFLFILFMNLLGLVPGFVAPTMFPSVTLGMAASMFVFYNAAGLKSNGAGYIKQFLGPVWWLIILIFPVELVSHFARPLSLTLRLYANMYAGEQVTTAFVGLTKIVVPLIFIALHTFACLLQAYIFMVLTMGYVGSAVSHEEH